MRYTLLDYLFEKSNENCLSDLKTKPILRRHLPWILSLENDAFQIEEWSYVYQYITQDIKVFSSVEEAKQVLSQWANSDSEE